MLSILGLLKRHVDIIHALSLTMLCITIRVCCIMTVDNNVADMNLCMLGKKLSPA